MAATTRSTPGDGEAATPGDGRPPNHCPAILPLAGTNARVTLRHPALLPWWVDVATGEWDEGLPYTFAMGATT